jgi:hypothetical protein
MLDNWGIWGSSIAVVVSAIIIMMVAGRFRKSKRFADNNVAGFEDIIQLEKFLAQQEKRLGRLSAELSQLAKTQQLLAKKQLSAISHIGVVRFNSYAEAGGNNSFSLALLDDHQNGVVVTSLYGRDTQRVYAKPVQNGDSNIPLTNEERQAILKSRD